MTFVNIKFLALLVLLPAAVRVPAQQPAKQRKANLEAAVANINALHRGSLVVRLATNARSLEAIQQSIEAAATARDRQRLEAMHERVASDTRQQQQLLMEAFRSGYSFSKVLFMPDTLSAKLKIGTRNGIFLNGDLRLDPTIQPADGPVFLVYYGASSSDQHTGNEGLTVADDQLQDLRDPFPFFTGRTSIRRMLQEFFDKRDDAYHYAQLVAKFQRRLEKFYQQYKY